MRLFFLVLPSGTGSANRAYSEKVDANVDKVVGPFYKQYPVVWYVFKENAWKLDSSLSGRFPENHQPGRDMLELPLIGMERTPVDYVGCTVWRTCDKTKWPTGEKDQERTHD